MDSQGSPALRDGQEPAGEDEGCSGLIRSRGLPLLRISYRRPSWSWASAWPWSAAFRNQPAASTSSCGMPRRGACRAGAGLLGAYKTPEVALHARPALSRGADCDSQPGCGTVACWKVEEEFLAKRGDVPRRRTLGIVVGCELAATSVRSLAHHLGCSTPPGVRPFPRWAWDRGRAARSQ